ncbi:MAG TPA: thioredoxin family protein [Lacunisphaera sp.]|nr:thioredoxin family protein [Lacunisphaera sp.]
MKLPRLLFLLLALPSLLPAAESSIVKKGAVAVSLVSDAAAIEPGKPFTVALRMQHDPHWHSYWIAPGTGYATSLAWTLPAGFKAGEIQWPTPHILRDSSNKIVGNGYGDEAFLLVEITPPATLAPGTEIKLTAVVEWLMCQDVCMPGDAKLSITFPVVAAGAGQPDAKWTDAINDTRAKLPEANTGWDVTASHTDKTATLRLTPKPGTKHQPANLHFFASDAFTDYARPQVVTQENGSWIITAPIDAAADKNSARLTGVLASSNGWSPGSGYDGLVIDTPLPEFATSVAGSAKGAGGRPEQNSGQTPGGQQTATGQPPAPPSTLLGTLLLAFVGGLILNLMPCVFPVLGIKILGFMNQSGSDRRKITLHGLVFALGVLLSFWALAAVLLVLRAGGSQLGWGFQLQSPGFVFGMAAFLLIFALNLSGLFEVGLSATGVGGNLQMKEGFAGSFFTGALATLVATPCSAPFLAPALGAALSLSAAESFMVFTAIAVGLALPYLLLSMLPAAVKMLPRPGAWMETFKQFMAFPLYATVGWLLWVLAGQTKDDDNALLLIAFGFVLVAMAAWAYGRFGQAHGKPGRQIFGRVFALLLLAGGLCTGWPKAVQAAPADGSYQVTWEQWSPEAVTTAQAAGKFVYVDFTARWCATCQTNKAVVFHSAEVLAELQKKNVVLLRGDWTNRDPKITAELARWNRSAVPFNLLYAPGKADPVILPELLTPGEVLEAFARAAK